MKTQTCAVREKRSAFTLIELIVVIVIITALLALLAPALFTALERGDTLSVVSEITQLDQALQAFSVQFGDYPPSSLSIPIVGGTWSVTDRAKVRAIWPDFDFATNGGLGNDGTGGNAGAINLNGAECLVFFLGGIQAGGTSSPQLAGFSKNPQTPWTTSENPDGPFMVFDLSRMTNLDSDTAFEYADPIQEQGTPYLYISAAGKNINRHNHNVVDDYDVFNDFNSLGNGQRDLSFCYVQADGKTPHRKDSFQIISAGADGEYGTGGVYGPDVTLADVPNLDGTAPLANAEDATNGLDASHFDPLDFVELRAAEADNITNFSGGETLN